MRQDQQEAPRGDCRPTGHLVAWLVPYARYIPRALLKKALARRPDAIVGKQRHAGRSGRLVLVPTTTNNFAVPWSRKKRGPAALATGAHNIFQLYHPTPQRSIMLSTSASQSAFRRPQSRINSEPVAYWKVRAIPSPMYNVSPSMG